MRSWACGAEGRNTWLTNAVRNADVEVVAILMYYGADQWRPCPRDGAINGIYTVSSQHHPRACIIATMLKYGMISAFGSIGHDDHLIGRDPKALLADHSHDTAMTLGHWL